MICYEFLYGYPPFHADTPDKVFENILSRRIDWHEGVVDVSPEARDFMERLMTLDPEKRLGCNGAEEVKQHPFFKKIQWDTFLTESPAFVPQPADMEDTDYFDLRGATMMKEQEGKRAELPEAEKQVVEQAKAIIREQNPENLDELNEQRTLEGIRLSVVNLHDVHDEQDPQDEFGTFVYKNLPVLEKANEDAIRKIRHDSIAADITKQPGQHRSLPAMPRRKTSTSWNPVAHPSGVVDETAASSPVTPVRMSPSVSAKTSTSTSPPAVPPVPPLPVAAPAQTGARLTRSRSASSPGDRLHTAATPTKEEARLSITTGPNTPAAAAATAGPLSPITTVPTQPPSSSATSSAYEAQPPPPAPAEGKRLLDCLVVDDNPISCKVLETILHTLQCRSVIVRNGAQAIRCAMSDDVKFDIIFMDIRMPISKWGYSFFRGETDN